MWLKESFPYSSTPLRACSNDFYVLVVTPILVGEVEFDSLNSCTKGNSFVWVDFSVQYFSIEEI